MTKRHTKKDIGFWVLFLSLGFIYGVYLLQRDAKEGFGSLGYGTVPYFSFDDNEGEVITLHKLKGKVWLVNFLSEEDSKKYPQVAAVMKALYDKFGDRENFRLLTVSSNDKQIDEASEEDDYQHWYFIKGDKEQLSALMKNAFYIDNRNDSFSSSLKIFLIDQNATIRGYYTISHRNDADRIEKNLIQLL